MIHNNTEEYLDVVDAADRVIAQERRSVVFSKDFTGGYFRAINLFIENDKGQLWIPRRAATKKLFPLGLDASVGGTVSAGESYETALVREAFEEAYLDLSTITYTQIGYLTPIKHGISGFAKVYKVHSNEPPVLNTDDFCEYYWLTPQELMARINAGDTCKSDLPHIIKYCYL